MLENHRQIQAVHARRIQNDIKHLWGRLERIVKQHKYLPIDANTVIDRFPVNLIPVKNYIEKCNKHLSRIQAGSLDSQDHNYAIQRARRHFNSAQKVIGQVTVAYPELKHEFEPINDFMQNIWNGTIRRRK